MDCLGNLHKCKASCCKTISFVLNVNLSQDQVKYYEYHGCVVSKIKHGTWRIIVPVKCKMLTYDYKCKLHGTPDKPAVCRIGPLKTKDYVITKGCLLEDE